jgi:FkbM family methyltransferase
MRWKTSNRVLVFQRHESDRHTAVLEFCKDFYASRTPSLTADCDGAISGITFQGMASWIEGMLSNPKVHDDDYVVLRYLKNPNSILLDIGANWGYSAGGFYKLGIRSCIVSYEIIPFFSAALEELKRRLGGRFHFAISGIGEYPGDMTFVVPVVNGVAEAALCSAVTNPHLSSLAKNILFFIDANPNLGQTLTLSFLEFLASVRPLDELVPNELPESFKELPVEAIKLDVEGLERAVLAGGKSLIRRFRPLILAEGANRTQGISELMESLGYIFAEREGDILVKVDGVGKKANGFFLHSDRLKEYQSLGVYRS